MHSEDNQAEKLWDHIEQLVESGSVGISKPGTKALYNGHDPEKLGALSNSLYTALMRENNGGDTRSMLTARDRLSALINEEQFPPALMKRMPESATSGLRLPPIRNRWKSAVGVVLLLAAIAGALYMVHRAIYPPACNTKATVVSAEKKIAVVASSVKKCAPDEAGGITLQSP